MAQLALRLPVFVASPSDVAEEREIAEKIIREVAREASRQQLLVEPFLWEEDAPPSLQNANDVTNQFLEAAELVVFIVWSRLGTPVRINGTETGTLEELRLTRQQVRRGSSDDAFMYFRTAPPEQGRLEDLEKVRQFRTELEGAKDILFCQYATPADFRRKFRKHLERWVEDWYGLTRICEYALKAPARIPSQFLGERLLLEVRRRFDYEVETEIVALLGDCAVQMYQRFGPQGSDLPIPMPDFHLRRLSKLAGEPQPAELQNFLATLSNAPVLGPAPLRKGTGDDLFFHDQQWFSFFCAAGLSSAIMAGQMQAVELRPYMNTVHQYLSVLGRQHPERLAPNLMRWLANTDRVTEGKPIVRNFAAYVLGMIGASEAQDILAHAARYDRGEDVALYSICSLGRLRARHHLRRLVDFFSEQDQAHYRLMASQAICRSVGIAEYEL
jgi:hypothetical protein